MCFLNDLIVGIGLLLASWSEWVFKALLVSVAVMLVAPIAGSLWLAIMPHPFVGPPPPPNGDQN